MSNAAQYIGDMTQAQRVFRALYNQAQILLENGKKLTLELTVHKQTRTKEQNAYYWLFNGELSDFLNNAGLSYGEYQIPYNKDIIHEINKKVFDVESTRKLKIGEFCEFMNKLLLWWQEKTNGEFMMSELPANYLERKGYFIK